MTVRHAKRVVHALEKARHIAIIVHGNGEGHSNKYQLLDGDTPVTVSASKTVTRQSPSEIQDGDTAGTQTVTQRVQDGDSPVTLTIIEPSMNHPCSDDASRKSIANDSNHTGGGMDGNKGKENDSWEDAATAARAQSTGVWGDHKMSAFSILQKFHAESADLNTIMDEWMAVSKAKGWPTTEEGLRRSLALLEENGGNIPRRQIQGRPDSNNHPPSLHTMVGESPRGRIRKRELDHHATQRLAVCTISGAVGAAKQGGGMIAFPQLLEQLAKRQGVDEQRELFI